MNLQQHGSKEFGIIRQYAFAIELIDGYPIAPNIHTQLSDFGLTVIPISP